MNTQQVAAVAAAEEEFRKQLAERYASRTNGVKVATVLRNAEQQRLQVVVPAEMLADEQDEYVDADGVDCEPQQQQQAYLQEYEGDDDDANLHTQADYGGAYYTSDVYDMAPPMVMMRSSKMINASRPQAPSIFPVQGHIPVYVAGAAATAASDNTASIEARAQQLVRERLATLSSAAAATTSMSATVALI